MSWAEPGVKLPFDCPAEADNFGDDPAFYLTLLRLMRATFPTALLVTLSCLILVLTTGCEKVQEARNQANAVAAAGKATSSMNEVMQEAADKNAARRERGDTLAVPYKQLQAYLPTSISGYEKAGDPQGQTMNMTGMSYSTCSQEYRAGGAESDNPKTVKVTIVDYNGAAAMYAGATAALGAGFSMEDEQQRMQGVDLGVKGVRAMETYQKQDHRASLTAGVSDRFFVTVEAEQQDDTELVKRVAQSLELSKLAEL